MAYGVVIVFDGVGADEYWKVNEQLGVSRDGSGDWPDGLLSHAAGRSGSSWVVSEVWASQAGQQRFMADRLGAAMAAVGVPKPSQVLEGQLENYQVPTR